MQIFAQHGFGDSDKIASGLSAGLLDGVLLSPRDLSVDSMKAKIETIRQTQANASILFDPQFYAALLASMPNARMGRLVSDYDAYFSPKQLRDIRREKQITDIVKRTIGFQKDVLGLDHYILPNILIQDGMQSESAGIAKSFLEVSDEIASALNINNRSWLTMALGVSAFRNEKRLENFLDEITGYGLQSKGIYLLVETSTSQGACPWHDPGILSGSMYISYVLSEAGYNVINGYTFYSAPFLSASGVQACASGWFDTLRCFSLDRFRPSSGGGKRPNRKYLSNALWSRIGLSEFGTYIAAYPWLANGLAQDTLFTHPPEVGRPNERDECLQHWESLKSMTSLVTESITTEERLQTLFGWIDRKEKNRAQIPVLSLPYHDQQIRDCKAALHRFAEQAEVSFP